MTNNANRDVRTVQGKYAAGGYPNFDFGLNELAYVVRLLVHLARRWTCGTAMQVEVEFLWLDFYGTHVSVISQILLPAHMQQLRTRTQYKKPIRYRRAGGRCRARSVPAETRVPTSTAMIRLNAILCSHLQPQLIRGASCYSARNNIAEVSCIISSKAAGGAECRNTPETLGPYYNTVLKLSTRHSSGRTGYHKLELWYGRPYHTYPLECST